VGMYLTPANHVHLIDNKSFSAILYRFRIGDKIRYKIEMLA